MLIQHTPYETPRASARVRLRFLEVSRENTEEEKSGKVIKESKRASLLSPRMLIDG